MTTRTFLQDIGLAARPRAVSRQVQSRDGVRAAADRIERVGLEAR